MKILINLEAPGACLGCPFIMEWISSTHATPSYYCEFFEEQIFIELPAPIQCPLRQEEITIVAGDP